MLPDLPAAASEGITLAPAPAAAEPAADATTLPEMEEAQPEEAEEVEAFSLDEMLMGLTPHVPEPPATPAPASEPEPEQESSPEIVATPDAVTAPAPPAVVAVPNFPLTPGEKIPLDVLLGKRKPNKAQQAALRLEVAPLPAPPKAPAVEPPKPILRPEPATPPAAAPGWVVPPEIAAQLTRREVLLLQQQPVLAQKLLQIEDNRLDARHVHNKIFLAFKSSAFSEEDVPALLAAGWVWQDILAEDDGIVRTLQRLRGVVLSANYSRILSRLLGMEKRWVVPSTDDLTEAELDALPAIIDAVIAAAQLDGTTSIPLWFVTPAVLARIAERHCMTSERLQFALLATRDAVYSAVRRRTYVRPVPEDLQCRNAGA
jgi:conjugal transfer pilus assembly protein TraI